MGDKLEGELQWIRDQGITAEGKLVYGTPWEKILEVGERQAADLLVIRSHGVRTPQGRMLLGSASHKLALLSRIPVLIVQAEPTGDSA